MTITNALVRQLARLAQDHGWTVRRSGSGHFKFIPPNGERAVTVPATPSDKRSLANSIAQLRRAGLPIPRKGQRKRS